MPATEPPAGRTRAGEAAQSTVEIKSSSAFFAAASLSFLSGAAGLAHQVLWTRRLVDVLGATSLTFSKVEVHRASVTKVPENLRAAHESGQFFLTLKIAAKVEAPVLPNLKAQIPLRLPSSLREDTTINWLQWPSRVKPSN